MSQAIPDALAEEAVTILKRLNRGYWDGLYWEFQENATQMFLRISITNQQNTNENIQAITCILRSVLAPLLPSDTELSTWCAVIEHEGGAVGGALGGMRDDWKTLGMET